MKLQLDFINKTIKLEDSLTVKELKKFIKRMGKSIMDINDWKIIVTNSVIYNNYPYYQNWTIFKDYVPYMSPDTNYSIKGVLNANDITNDNIVTYGTSIINDKLTSNTVNTKSGIYNIEIN